MARKVKLVAVGSVDDTAAQYLADHPQDANVKGLTEYLASKGIAWQESTIAAFGSRIKAVAQDSVTKFTEQSKDAAYVAKLATAANCKPADIMVKHERRIAFWRNVAQGQAACFPKQARAGRTAQSPEERMLALLG